MSQSAGIEIVIMGTAGLIQALVELGLAYREQKKFQTDDGKSHAVDMVVEDQEGAKVGVKVDSKTGRAELIAHDCKGTKGKALAGRIAQRYAYSKVVDELKKKGYQVAKEEVQADGSIKVVAQRWK